MTVHDKSFSDDDDAKKEREAIMKKKFMEERKAKKEQVLAWKVNVLNYSSHDSDCNDC